MTSVSKRCRAKSEPCLTEYVRSYVMNMDIFADMDSQRGHRQGYITYLRSEVPSYFTFLLFAPCSLFLPVSPCFSVSPGNGPVDVGPSGQSLRRDTRSAWCSGQTLQQRFLCSTHLLVLAHSSGPQHRSGQALANTLVQQPDHFTQDFSVSTVGSNQMWEWNRNSGLWTVG